MEQADRAADALAHVRDGMSVALTGGSTTTEVARALLARNDLTIVTNAVNIAAVRPEAAARKIQIESVLAEPGLVLGDARRLEQVVWNLTWHAVKFTQPSGKVTVRLVPAGGALVRPTA